MSTTTDLMTDSTELTTLTTAVTTDAPSGSDDSVLGPLLAVLHVIILIIAGVINVMTVVVWVRVPVIRRPYNYFTAQMVIADVVAVIVWCLPALISAAAGPKWLFGSVLCTGHTVVSTWVYSLTTTTFMVVAFERFLKLCFPSRHVHAYYSSVVWLQLMATWLYSFVLAMFPMLGWGEVRFFDFQTQCHFLYERSVSHHNFTFVVTFIFPLLFSVIFHAVAQWKVHQRRKQSPDSDKQVILEENHKIPHESYDVRLQQAQARYQKRAKLGPQSATRTDPESSSDSEVSENEAQPTHAVTSYEEGEREMRRRRGRKRRVYVLRRRDVSLDKLHLILVLIYMALWFPFWVVSYVWVYDTSNAHTAVHAIVTLVSFLGICFKPFVLYTHRPFKKAAHKVYPFCKRKDDKKKTPSETGDNVAPDVADNNM